MAVQTDGRKLALSGWLRKNHKEIYDDPEKFQRFLLLYECFSKAEGEEADLEGLVWQVESEDRA